MTERREEEERVAEAFRKPMTPISAILENVNLYRSVLDNRVIRDVEDLGCSPGELEEMRARMQRWSDEVTARPAGESPEQRRIRVRTLEQKLYPDKPVGCGCRGSGFIHVRADIRRKNKTHRDAEYCVFCTCDRGREKLEVLKGKNKKKGRRSKDGDGFEEVFDK